MGQILYVLHIRMELIFFIGVIKCVCVETLVSRSCYDYEKPWALGHSRKQTLGLRDSDPLVLRPSNILGVSARLDID
jgi:hypothetical protein